MLRTLLTLGLTTLLLTSTAPALAQSGSKAPAGPPSGTYTIDGGHSTVMFRVKHMKTAYFYGFFMKKSGSVHFDASDPSKSKIKITIDADSVFTGIKRRDDHLRSADFLNVKQFPTATFESTKIAARKGSTTEFEVTGDLTLHGATNEVTFTYALTGHGARRGKTLIGGHATLTIKRSDYDIKHMIGGLSDEIQLTISLEATMGGSPKK